MASRIKRFCKADGCRALTDAANGFCEEHQYIFSEKMRLRNDRRQPSRKRGYTSRWDKYSKWFLQQPGNQLCALRLDDSCAIIAQCVDHIDPPDGANDPKFWDKNNHQPACIHCNSVKNHKKIIGKYRAETDGADDLRPADPEPGGRMRS